MILIISHLADEHATEVLKHLGRSSAGVLLFDTGHFPGDIKLNIRHANDKGSSLSAAVDGVEHDLSAVNAVWWRRPQPFSLDISMTDRDDRDFAFGECQAALTGLYSCLDVFWMNDPVKDEVAARKAYQLKVAAGLGLRIPRTLITNDPGEAEAFIDAEGGNGTIYKAFSATEAAWRETRLLKEEERSKLEAVRFAPVIFQEHIRADIDLRITIIGDEIFPAEILSGETQYHVDFRMTMHEAPIRPHDLPVEVREKLLAFMRSMGIVYGAIDMRRTSEGEYVFLEVNPAGQWLFVEQRTEQPITGAIASYLMKADRKSLMSSNGRKNKRRVAIGAA